MTWKATVRDALFASPLRPFLFPEPEFVIVGTGRSGTGYIARLLTEAGIPCGHENWWRTSGKGPLHFRMVGEASWVANFQLDGYDGPVFNQVRDPIRVVNSIIFGKGELLSGKGWGYPMRARWVDFTGDDKVDALNIFVTFARQSEKVSEWTWRLEDIDAALLQQICERVGRPITHKEAEEAIAAVPRDTNRHADSQRIGWDDLPDIPLKAEAMGIARQYGYL